MVDVVDGKTRSRMMAGIRGRNTRPEVTVRRLLHAHGFRFRLHVAELPGRPDMVLAKHRVAIFVHGCFWHRHQGCPFCTSPATRPDFWQDKFARNVSRDEQNIQSLTSAGMRVAIVWECAIRAKGKTGWFDALADWIRAASHDQQDILIIDKI